MKATTTKEMGNEHEKFVAELYSFDDAHRSRSSGANSADNLDVSGETIAIECEATEAKSYRLTLDFWQEVVRKAKFGQQPALAVRLRDPHNGRHIDLLVIDINDDVEQRYDRYERRNKS